MNGIKGKRLKSSKMDRLIFGECCPQSALAEMIPVIDVFAGPGGLGEGFSAFRVRRQSVFKIALSIEKDQAARETLQLRSFFRQFGDRAPNAYYDFLRGKIALQELYRKFPTEASKADKQAWLAELGNPQRTVVTEVDERITKAVGAADKWVLIGGPPCQAYSVVGRARMAQNRERHEKDPRHHLYREYLRILAIHRPPVFVMENVKGILSSKVEGSLIINRILSDLKRPCESVENGIASDLKNDVTYELYPFAAYGANSRLFTPKEYDPSAYVIRCERHGIPQARHRLILLGIRKDVCARPRLLSVMQDDIPMWNAINDLPRLRSRLSNGLDSPESWANGVRQVSKLYRQKSAKMDFDVWQVLQKMARSLSPSLNTGGEFVPSEKRLSWQCKWFYDRRLGGICNHSARSHMTSDLWRYFFASCFAAARKKSPVLTEYPTFLFPEHKNAKTWEGEAAQGMPFDDRFKVQVKHRPATTITAHMAKDGHYFIHPDPLQCRSLTVREAARLQTFPDNYLFLGPRSQQYQQVGNAVPPLLARQLAAVVYGLLSGSQCKSMT